METTDGKTGNVNTMRKRTQRTLALEKDILENVSGLSYRQRKIAERIAHARFARLGKCPAANSRKNLHHMKLDNTSFRVCRIDRTGPTLQNKDTLSRAFENKAWTDTVDSYQKDSIVSKRAEHIAPVVNDVLCRETGKPNYSIGLGVESQKRTIARFASATGK